MCWDYAAIACWSPGEGCQVYITHKDLAKVPEHALESALWFVSHHQTLFPPNFASKARSLRKEKGPALELNDICAIIRFFSLMYSAMSGNEGDAKDGK
jgi:hypothetical protein